MTYLMKFDPPIAGIKHYGTKGMKWGVHNPHHSYSEGQQQSDRKFFGKSGVRRINKRLHKGKSRRKAVEAEGTRQFITKTATVLVGVTAARITLGVIGPMAISSFVGKSASKAGAKAASNMFANSHGLPRYDAINLTYNAAKNLWE